MPWIEPNNFEHHLLEKLVKPTEIFQNSNCIPNTGNQTSVSIRKSSKFGREKDSESSDFPCKRQGLNYNCILLVMLNVTDRENSIEF